MQRLVLALFLIFGLSTGASADRNKEGFYFQLDGGTAQFADSEINRRDVTFDEGWSVNGRLGGENERLAVELELGIHGANYQPIGDGYGPAIFLTAGLNILYKFLRLPGLDAYAGFGAGYLTDGKRPINALQVNAHAETGFTLRPSKSVQLVPHVRTMVLFGASEDQIGRTQSYSQVISTARLGVRFTPKLKY